MSDLINPDIANDFRGLKLQFLSYAGHHNSVPKTANLRTKPTEYKQGMVFFTNVL